MASPPDIARNSPGLGEVVSQFSQEIEKLKSDIARTSPNTGVLGVKVIDVKNHLDIMQKIGVLQGLVRELKKLPSVSIEQKNDLERKLRSIIQSILEAKSSNTGFLDAYLGDIRNLATQITQIPVQPTPTLAPPIRPTIIVPTPSTDPLPPEHPALRANEVSPEMQVSHIVSLMPGAKEYFDTIESSSDPAVKLAGARVRDKLFQQTKTGERGNQLFQKRVTRKGKELPSIAAQCVAYVRNANTDDKEKCKNYTDTMKDAKYQIIVDISPLGQKAYLLNTQGIPVLVFTISSGKGNLTPPTPYGEINHILPPYRKGSTRLTATRYFGRTQNGTGLRNTFGQVYRVHDDNGWLDFDDSHAQMSTAVLALDIPGDAYYFHGTNYETSKDRGDVFLGNKHSKGCIRMSNLGIALLSEIASDGPGLDKVLIVNGMKKN